MMIVPVLVSWLLGLLLAYFMSESKLSDEPVLNSLVSSAGSLFRVLGLLLETALTPLYFLQTLPLLWVFRVGCLVSLALFVHMKPLLLLESLDGLWRRVLYPVIKIGVLDVLMVFKFGFDTFAPLYNMGVVLYAQVSSGTLKLAGNCGADNLMEGANLGTQAFVSLLLLTTQWSVPASISDNMFTRELNITEPIWKLQQAVAMQEQTAACMCEALTPTWAVAFETVRSPSLARGVNSGFNTALSVVQQFAVSLPPLSRIPDFYRTFYYSKQTLLHFGRWGDDVAVNSVEKITGTALNAPTPFALETLSCVGSGFMEVGATAVSILSHIVVPSKLTNSSYMMRVTSFRYVWKEWDRAVDGTGGLVEWLLNLVSRSITDNVPISNVQAIAAGNVIRWGLRSAMGLPNVVLEMLNELAWKSFFTNEQNVVKTLQSYDGKWLAPFSLSERPCLSGLVFNPLLRSFDALFDFVPVAFSPLKSFLRFGVQSIHVLLRVLLSGDQILEGTFFDRPIDCHYGLGSEECGLPYTGTEMCQRRNSASCMYNPALSGSAQCLFTAKDPGTNSAQWCNTLLYEFLFSEVEEMVGGGMDLVRMLLPDSCDETDVTYIGLTSNTNVLCALTGSIEQLVRLPLNVFRHVIGTTMSLTLGYEQRTFELKDRLEDFDQLFYDTMGILPIPLSKEPMMNAVYSVLRLPMEVVRFVQYMFDWVLEPDLDWRVRLNEVPCAGCSSITLTDSALDFVMVELRVVFGYVVTLVNSLVAVFDTVGAAVFFEGVRDILLVLEKALSNALLELLGLVLTLVVDMLDYFASGNLAKGMLDRVLQIFLKFANMLAKIATKILDAFLLMLGPFGKFLLQLKNAVCDTLKSALSWVGVTLDIAACSSLLGSDDLGASHIPTAIYSMGWNGTSECDYIVHAHRGYNWGDLRPLEQIRLSECVEQRELAHELNTLVGIDLPVDLFYNWKRKFEMGYHGTFGLLLYMQHTSTRDLFQALDSRDIPRYWIDVYRSAQEMEVRLPSLRELAYGLREHEVGVVLSAVDSLTDTVDQLRETWVAKNMSHSWRLLGSSMSSEVSSHVSRVSSHVSRVSHATLEATTKMTSQFSFAWGLHTDPSSGECSLLDNLMETVKDESERVSTFYTTVYAPITVPHFVAWIKGRDPWVEDFLAELDRTWTLAFRLPDGRILSPLGYIDLSLALTHPEWWSIDVELYEVDLGRLRLKTDLVWRLPTIDDFKLDLQLPSMSDLISFPSGLPEGSSESGNPRYSNTEFAEPGSECSFDAEFPNNITEAVGCFLTETGDGTVPYFGHNLDYILNYQFNTCEFSQIQCTEKTSVRIERIVESFWYCFVAILSCLVLQFLTGIPTMMFLPIFPIFGLIFLTHTWNWTYACRPNVPPCFADDIYAFVDAYLVPKCFCTYFPALSNECLVEGDFCQFSSGSTSFSQCSEEIPYFGYMWVPFYYMKVYFPTQMRWLYYFLYNNTALSAWMNTLDTVTPVEVDCAQLHVLDLSFPLAAVLTLLLILPRVLNLGARLALGLLQYVLSLLALVYSVCLVLESSIELEQEEQDLQRFRTLLEKVKVETKEKEPIKEPIKENNSFINYVGGKNFKLDRLPSSTTRKRVNLHFK